MIRLDADHLLMIEPTKLAHPVILDSLTRRMVAAMRISVVPKEGYRGFHTCVCGMASDNRDHFVSCGDGVLKTNSLAVHYIACHRDEVPESEMEKLRMLPDVEADAMPEDLYGRRSRMRDRTPADVDLEC